MVEEPTIQEDFGIVEVKDEHLDLPSTALHLAEPASTGNYSTVKEEAQVIESIPDQVILQVPPNLGRRRQRQQVIVLLPTLAEVQRKKAAKDDDLTKLGKLFKPKKGANALVLNETILISRLKPIGLDGFPVNLPRAELNQMASRWFMSSTYGGSMHTTFSSVAPKRVARHGIAHFMYLNLKYHPYAPQVPGGGGLWFNPSPDWHGDPMDHVQRIFTRDGKMAMWQYMGQYEIRAAPALSIEEWLGLSEKTRKDWASKICAKEWGREVCATIQARKEIGPGREPTQEEVYAVIKAGRWELTPPEDVKMAFDCGKQRMGVWTLKCVDYDYNFQLEICDKYPKWIPPRTNTKKKTKNGGKRSKAIKEVKTEVKIEDKPDGGSSSKSSRGKKRKRAITPESESDTEGGSGMPAWTEKDEVIEVTDDEEAVFLMKLRTRKRTNTVEHLYISDSP